MYEPLIQYSLNYGSTKIDAFNMTPSSSQKDFYEENNSGNFKIVSSPCNFFWEIRDRQAGSIW